MGDGSAFWAGHRSQREILSSWPLNSYPRVVAQSEAFFRRWGVWAVFFARFVPPIRAFVPITAGALDMPPARFYAVNIPAILIWAPLHVLPGVMAVSVLDRYGVFQHTGGSAKHHWIPLVIAAGDQRAQRQDDGRARNDRSHHRNCLQQRGQEKRDIGQPRIGRNKCNQWIDIGSHKVPALFSRDGSTAGPVNN